jgi:hypothetical protein
MGTLSTSTIATEKKTESFGHIKNNIMLYANPTTLHVHYDLEKPGYHGR